MSNTLLGRCGVGQLLRHRSWVIGISLALIVLIFVTRFIAFELRAGPAASVQKLSLWAYNLVQDPILGFVGWITSGECGQKSANKIGAKVIQPIVFASSNRGTPRGVRPRSRERTLDAAPKEGCEESWGTVEPECCMVKAHGLFLLRGSQFRWIWSGAA